VIREITTVKDDVRHQGQQLDAIAKRIESRQDLKPVPDHTKGATP
jgi:hypothetical protein